MPLPLPNSPPALESCPYCSGALTFIQQTNPGHCGAWDCTRAHAAFAAKRSKAAWRADYAEKRDIAQEQKAAEIERLIVQHDIAPDRVHLAPVPQMNTPVVALPQDRKDNQLAHLRQIITDAFARPVSDTSEETRDLQAEEAEKDPWTATACGTCRGDCCRQGADSFGFQTADTIHDLRINKPEMSAEDIFDYYENALPTTSVKGACVYQGDLGCVLPRDMRADICNTFHCYSLRRLTEDVDRSKTDAVVMVSIERGKADRVAIYPLADKDAT